MSNLTDEELQERADAEFDDYIHQLDLDAKDRTIAELLKALEHDTRYIRNCIDYILAHEKDDYENWCNENDLVSGDFPNQNHIYASACIADIDLSIIEERQAKMQGALRDIVENFR